MVSQQSKPTSESGRPAAERPFVDREEPLAIFQAALSRPQPTKPLVLVFHGGAGTGKSRLRRELTRLVNCSSPEPRDPGTPEPPLRVTTAALDFDGPVHRQPDAALFFLRNALRDAYKVTFPSFDLAYAVLWQKSHADSPLGDDLKPLREPGSLLSQLLDESGKLPLIGLVPKVSALVDSRQNTVGRDSPTSYLLPPNYFATWWRERGERELEDLPQMEPVAIVEQLPKLWAADIRDYLGAASHKSQAASKEPGGNLGPESYHQDTKTQRGSGRMDTQGRRAVLFVDSYEKLWGTGDEGRRTRDEGQKTDAWVREMVKQLPEALWVISGRQKLRWEEVEKEWGDVLNQHELGALSEHSARQFLSGCGITGEPIQDAIAKGSRGLPHYLSLAVDTFQEIKQSGQRAGSVKSLFSEAESSDSPEQMFEQFIRHLDQPEIATLQVLSASRFWNYGLFEHLVTEYQTGYPLTAYDDLSRFSFVGEGSAPETRTMHDLMREALQEHQAPDLRKRVHLFLHEYYAKQLEGLDVKNITEKHKAALNEAFYHGRRSKSAAEFWSWFGPTANVFHDAYQHRLLTPLYREMVQTLETEIGPDHTDTVAALHALADDLTDQGEYDQAELLYQRALAAREKLLGPEHLDVAMTLNRFSHLRLRQGRFADAESLLRRAHAVSEMLLGADCHETAAKLSNLGGVLFQLGRYDEAEPLLRRALATMQKVGPEHPNVARTLDNLANVLDLQGKHLEAEALYRRALVVAEKVLGPEHPNVAATQCNLADLLFQSPGRNEGRCAEAETLARCSLAIREKALGLQHPYLTYSLGLLARLLIERGEYAEADALSRRALAIEERALGPQHPDVAITLHDLATSRAVRGKYAEAEPLLRRSLAIREKALGTEHPVLDRSLNDLAWVLLKQGKYAEAEPLFRRALKLKEEASGPNSENTAETMTNLANLLADQGRYAEAEPLARRAIAILEKALRPEGPERPEPLVAETSNQLAGLYCRGGRHAEAEALYHRALAIREKAFGPDHLFLAETLDGLAKVCEQTGRSAEAQELSSRAKAIREKNAEAAHAQATSPT